MKKLLFVSLIIINLQGYAQRTLGLLQYDIPNTDGYILFAPNTSNNTFLIDKCGLLIHQWNATCHPGQAVYLLDDGTLLRTGNSNNTIFTSGGTGGFIQKFDWSGNMTWNYIISDSNQCQHHDVRQLPNGNVLAICWDKHLAADAIQNGKNPTNIITSMWSEKIVEIQPTGTNTGVIVWEWDLWNHLVQEFDSTKLNYATVSQHPELVNINFTTGPPSGQDWIHMNGIDYNAALDQILVSTHNLSELWIIDHSTTSAEAASHTGGNSGKGGDILYRWGNPQVYNRGLPADQKLFGQHNPTWIPAGYPNAGKIIVFNNGLNRPAGNYSSIDIFIPDMDSLNHYPIGVSTAYLPSSLFWTYTDPNPIWFYGSNISGVNPLLNGSFFITTGPAGTFFEIDSAKNTVWKYISPVANAGILSQGTTPTMNSVFRGTFYAPNFPGFTGHTLIPGTEIELNPIHPSICDSLLGINNLSDGINSMNIYPNPSSEKIYISLSKGSSEKSLINILNLLGENVFSSELQPNKSEIELNISGLKKGMYIINLSAGLKMYHKKIVLE